MHARNEEAPELPGTAQEPTRRRRVAAIALFWLLSAGFFFEPLPFVRRVVFIGTPHQGASVASGVTGKLLANLVNARPEDDALHQYLTSFRPPILTRQFRSRFPTSVDLLSNKSPLLDAMRKMPF